MKLGILQISIVPFTLLLFLLLIFSCKSQKSRTAQTPRTECQDLISAYIHQGDELCDMAKFSSKYEVDKMYLLDEAMTKYNRTLAIECIGGDTSEVRNKIQIAELLIQEVKSDINDELNEKRKKCLELRKYADEDFEEGDYINARLMYQSYLSTCNLNKEYINSQIVIIDSLMND